MSTEIKNFRLNFGPQHPAAHGVLRLIVELDGERIERSEPHIGLLHRGSEKLMEDKAYNQNVPFFERMDYVSAINQPYAYVLAVEKLAGIQVPKRGQYLRMLVSELSRIGSHSLSMGALANDVGAITPLILGLEIRERISEFCERASGARMHGNYIRPGGVSFDMKQELLDDILTYMDDLTNDIQACDDLLSENRIFKQRTVDIGVISAKQALSYGFTGPNLRACGVEWDIRKSQPYDAYEEIDFNIAVSSDGDTYARYAVRLFEIRETIKIVRQLIKNMPAGRHKTDDEKFTNPKRKKMQSSMESLIHHFKLFSEGYHVPAGEVYESVEAPKGEFGVYVIADGTNKPYRVKVKTTSVPHLSALNELTKGHMLSDIPAILGSIDIVFGESDR